MRVALIIVLACCGAPKRPFNGVFVPDSEQVAIDVLRVILEMHRQGCEMFKIKGAGGTEVIRRETLTENPQTGADDCGYFDGRVVYAKQEFDGCSALVHEMAHAAGYEHMTWPPLMWGPPATESGPPWLPLDEQIRQLIDLTGCNI